MEKAELLRKIGKRLTSVREHLELFQGTMAEHLGISRVNLYRLEKGIVWPNAHIMNILRTRFNVSLDWLVTGEGDMIREEKEDKDKFDYGQDAGMVTSLLEVMHKVPFVRYAILNYFLDFYDEHQEVIEKTLSEYDRLQGKMKDRPEGMPIKKST